MCTLFADQLADFCRGRLNAARQLTKTALINEIVRIANTSQTKVIIGREEPSIKRKRRGRNESQSFLLFSIFTRKMTFLLDLTASVKYKLE